MVSLESLFLDQGLGGQGPPHLGAQIGTFHKGRPHSIWTMLSLLRASSLWSRSNVTSQSLGPHASQEDGPVPITRFLQMMDLKLKRGPYDPRSMLGVGAQSGSMGRSVACFEDILEEGTTNRDGWEIPPHPPEALVRRKGWRRLVTGSVPTSHP